MSTPTLSERVRRHLDDALYHRRITRREACRRITRATGETWGPWKLGRLLNGTYDLSVDDMAAIASAAGISVVELVREHGRELIADLTPSELRIIQALRERPDMVEPIAKLLGPPAKVAPTKRTIRARMKDQDDE